MHLFGSARLLLESKLEYIIPKYENLLMDDFLAYLADTVESHFIKKTDLNGTINVLGIIALTAYKETSQQIINLKLELSIMSLIC